MANPPKAGQRGHEWTRSSPADRGRAEGVAGVVDGHRRPGHGHQYRWRLGFRRTALCGGP